MDINLTLTENPTLEQLTQIVQLKRRKVAEYKYGFLTGAVTYDELADAGRELSAALFEYAKVKFPNVKPRRLPYQSIIR